MPSRRDVVLDALTQWRAEGALDDATYERLAAKAGALDAREGAETPRPFVGQATQFVGGLLLGAALVAFVIFADLEDEPARWAMFLLGLIAAGVGVALDRFGSPERGGLADALTAAGLVPLGVAAIASMDVESPLLPGLVAAVAVALHAFKRGQGPIIMLCVAAASLASFGATVRFFEDTSAATSLAWLLFLLSYLGLALVWRREAWSSAACGALVIPMTIAFIMLVADVLPDADSLVFQALVACLLGALFALGLLLDVRGLVAASAAGLTIDAVVFAFDLGGAGTAVIVLLALGGLLVWQGQGIRAYFKRRERA